MSNVLLVSRYFLALQESSGNGPGLLAPHGASHSAVFLKINGYDWLIELAVVAAADGIRLPVKSCAATRAAWNFLKPGPDPRRVGLVDSETCCIKDGRASESAFTRSL